MERRLTQEQLQKAECLVQAIENVPQEHREEAVAFMNVYMDGFLAGRGVRDNIETDAKKLAFALSVGKE